MRQDRSEPSVAIGRVRWIRTDNCDPYAAPATSITATPTAPAPSIWRRLGAALSPRSTPGSFRLAATWAGAVCAACAVVGSLALTARAGSLDAADTAAQQLTDIEEVRTALVEADSFAALAYLETSAVASQRRLAYETRLGDGTRLLARVTQRAPLGDLEQLSLTSTNLTEYGALAEQAAANDRQGYPVGAAYQRAASALLREDLLPRLEVVDRNTRDRLNDSLADASRNAAIALVLLGVAVAVLGAVSWLLFARTRRLVNVPIAIGVGLLVAALAWGGLAMATTARTLRSTVDTSLTGLDALARARTAAYDARSAELSTLINRGTGGAADEADWLLADAKVVDALDLACSSTGDCVGDEWAIYQTGHDGVRALDESGDYDGAVLEALEQGSSFAVATGAMDDARAIQASEVGTGFDDAAAPLGALRWFVLVAGLVAAAMVVVGFGQRLREYR